MSDKLSLKEILEVFVKVVQELEKSMLFPSLLIDIPVHSVGNQTSKIFKDNVLDCRDLYHALILLKNQVIDGFKQQWQDLSDSSFPLLCNLGVKLRGLYSGLSGASSAAAMLLIRYRGAVQEQFSPSHNASPSRTDSVEDDNFFTTMTDFENKLQEVEEIILIPAILYDLQDEDILACLELSASDALELRSLRDVYSYLLAMREQIFAPRSELRGDDANHSMWREIKDTYATFKELVELSCGLMQRYSLELERSTGEKLNTVAHQKLCIASLEQGLGDLKSGRSAHIMYRIEQTMKVA